MINKHREQLNKYDEKEQELELAIEVVRVQRREYINKNNLNKANNNEQTN